MFDVATYIGQPAEVGIKRVPAFVAWLQGMIRKHGYICVGYDRLKTEMRITEYDLVVRQTLQAMGIAPPEWSEILQDARIMCMGWDRRGMFFVHGTGASDCTVLYDLEEYGSAVLPDYTKCTEGTNVKFISVPGVLPTRLVK